MVAPRVHWQTCKVPLQPPCGLEGMLNTILIVDDDESTRTFLSTLLQGAGYGVVVAGGVKAGLQVLEETWVDLLVADVRLGDANGLQLIAMSRQSMPTIAITGFDDPVIEAQARQFGATFLLKPFTSESLLALVEKRLRPITRPTPCWGEKRGNASQPSDLHTPGTATDITSSPLCSLVITASSLRRMTTHLTAGHKQTRCSQPGQTHSCLWT